MQKMFSENYGGNVHDVVRRINDTGMDEFVFGIYPASAHGGVVVFRCLYTLEEGLKKIWSRTHAQI